MADAPIHVEPIDDSRETNPAAATVARSGRGLLSYRTIRWISTVGVAPRWIDLILLLVAALGVVLGLSFLIVLLDANSWFERVFAAVMALAGGAIVGGSAWWSNHFRRRRIDDDTDPAAIRPPEPWRTETEQRSENVV